VPPKIPPLKKRAEEHPGTRPYFGVLRCVYGEHKERNPQCPAEAGDQETTGEAGEVLRPQLEFSDLRRSGVLRGRSGTNVGRNPPGRPANQIRALHPALRNHPHLGRGGADPGIRQLVIGGAPYIVLYRVQGKRVTISTIWHGSQQKER